MHKVSLRNNTVYIDDNEVHLNGIHLVKEISWGANGVVYEGFDELLRRPVAVKFWQQLRITDQRDKLQQGLLEAQKAWQAQGENVVEVYSAGIAHDCLYLIMEHVVGSPLGAWLTDVKPSLGVKWNLTYALMSTLRQLDQRGLYHGDLHLNNILVARKTHYSIKWSGYHESRTLSYKIIDFGTSHFSSSPRSITRHYQIIEQTIDRLLRPLDIEKLYGHAKPDGFTAKFYSWVQDFLMNLRWGLMALDFRNVTMPDGHAIHPYMGFDPERDYLSTPEASLLFTNLKKVVSEGLLTENLGTRDDWDERIT